MNGSQGCPLGLNVGDLFQVYIVARSERPATTYNLYTVNRKLRNTYKLSFKY